MSLDSLPSRYPVLCRGQSQQALPVDMKPAVIASAARQSSVSQEHTMSCFVYIMTNANETVLYTGVTNNLERRVYQHRTSEGSTFTKRHQVKKLVFYERFKNMNDAIAAEKRIKAGSRVNKIKLIEEQNPAWNDLADKD
jgi:putative endonuclease